MQRSGITARYLTPAGLLLALLWTCNVAVASTFEANTMRFERLSVADGLAQSSVMAIAQDHDGFMWFATESGLDRYDGAVFRHYRTERGNPNALASDFVRDLDVAADGSLWIATDGGGMSRWDPLSDQIRTYRHRETDDNSIASDRVRTVLAADDGSVWIGTRGAGLNRLDVDSGEFTHFVNAPDDVNTLSSNDIYAMAPAGQDSLWIATSAGLDRLNIDTGNVTRVDISAVGDDANSVIGLRALHVSVSGDLWIGSSRHGLFRYNPDSGETIHYTHDAEKPGSLSSNHVDAIFEDDRGRLWVGTDNGLNLMDAETGQVDIYRNEPNDLSTISDNGIFALYQDASGLLWVGTRTGGLSKWNPRSWSFGYFKPQTSGPHRMTSSNITAFTEDYDGNSWVGTFGGGINMLNADGHLMREIRHDPQREDTIGDDRVMALITDRHGTIWAGTMRGGLSRIDAVTGAVTTYQHDPESPDSLSANGIMSLMQDNSGLIWAGTFGGGVSRLDPRTGKFTNFRHDPNDSTTLSSARATAIAQGRDGVIWVGTDGGGLNYFDPRSGNWHQVMHDPDNPQSLSANTIYTLHVDPRGRLWVGSRQGIDRISAWPLSSNGARVIDISTPDPLMRSAVFGIESDLRGNLWMSTGQGLASYNPDSGLFRAYHQSHGLQGEEFNFGASYASPDGTLYFGGASGFNRFKASELEVNDTPPPVVLTSLSILNEPVVPDRPFEHLENLELGYKDYSVTFTVAALDYAAPAQNRFAYMLEGFDDDWVEAGNERRITYTNLDGGHYSLRVKAANSDGFWNETGIELPLTVAYAPWQTWWAYSLYAIAVLAAVLGFWRQQQLKLQRESEYSGRLETEVRERTQELHERNADLNRVNAKLMEASTTDALTGLRNRRYLFQNIEQHVDLVLRHYRDGVPETPPGSNSDLLLLMVDLDNFKPVNDNCGHEAGDRLLLQVRDVLLEACRKTDDVIRWGGDEFLIIARDTNSYYAATLAERVRTDLSDRIFTLGDGQVARITSSVGYASYPFIKKRPDLLSWEEVLGIADAAMYEAKQSRNAWLGIEGVEWSGSGEELYRVIKSSPGQLAEDGVIRAIESVDEALKDTA
jgi:diguanylate cyclase (GGDEF)-like protein